MKNPLRISSVSPLVLGWLLSKKRGDKRGVRLVATDQPGQYDIHKTQFSSPIPLRNQKSARTTSSIARTLLATLALLMAIVLAAGAFRALPQETVLTGFVTPLAGRSVSQRHNALLAAARLDGARIEPGQMFSFNERVGTFSRDQGYRKAPDWGGGVCQVSTTLYNAALLADLDIVERHRHRFCPSYVPPGRDAAVAFSDIDLRFRNPHPYPVWIKARLDDRFIHVDFVATQPLKRKPQIVEVVESVDRPESFTIGRESSAGRVRNSGKLGYDVCVFRIHGTRRELISQDSYPAMNRVVEYR
jgi:vancomycin resistance protein VanW